MIENIIDFVCGFRLGSDPDKIFPETLMKEHLRKFAKFGLIMALWMLAATTCDSSTKINLDESCERFEDGKKIDKNPFISNRSLETFTSRMRGVIADMVRLGYI